MKINEVISEQIPWVKLRHAGAVMPYLYTSPKAVYPDPQKDPKFYKVTGLSQDLAGKMIPPDPKQPNIITSINLKTLPRPGEKLEPLPNMSDAEWQKYMDDNWPKLKPEKKNQIKQAAAAANPPVTIKEFDNPREKSQVQPRTTMTSKEIGDRVKKAKEKLTKKPASFDFSRLFAKDKPASEDAAGVGIITKQNTTVDVKPGDEYKNVKKLGLSK